MQDYCMYDFNPKYYQEVYMINQVSNIDYLINQYTTVIENI